MKQQIHSNIFKLNQRQFILLLTKLVALKWLIIPLALLLTAVIVTCITSDIRYAIVAMMILFIIIPMLLAFLYISYGLLENCYINIINHEIIFSDRHIKLIGHVKVIMTNEEESESEEKIIERTIDWSCVSKVIYNFNDVVLLLDKPKFGFLLIPLSEFKSKDEINQLVCIIKSKTDSIKN